MAKILIVDDDETIGLMIKDILKFNGYEVIVSQQPMLTKQNILQHEIDLVLLDKLIAGIDGTDVCRELKLDERVSNVPVLMMSALNNVDQICKDAGAADFLSKPFNMENLLSKTEEVLKESGKS